MYNIDIMIEKHEKHMYKGCFLRFSKRTLRLFILKGTSL